MEKGVYYTLYLGINIRYIHLCSSSEVLNVIKCVFTESVRQGCCRTLDEMIGKGKFVRKLYDVNVSGISGRKIHKKGKADIS